MLIVLFIFNINALYAFELRTAAQDIRPKFIKVLQNEKSIMAGLEIDIIRAIESVDSDIKFIGQNSFMPIGRIITELKSGRLDIFIGAGKTDSRIKNLIFIDPPLYPVHHVLLAKIDEPLNITSYSQLKALGKKGSTLTILNTGTQRHLEAIGDLKVTPIQSVPTMLELVALGRARFAYYHDLGLTYAARKYALDDAFKILPTKFHTYHHYAVLSKHTPNAYLKRIKSAIIQLKKSGILRKIHQKYTSVQ